MLDLLFIIFVQNVYMKQLYRFALIPFSLIVLCGSLTHSFAQKKNNAKSTAQIIGDDGVSLRVDVEYAVNKKNVVVNDRYIEYTVTNIGSVTFNGKIEGKKNAIVFDLTTKDGKIIEKSVSFMEILSPGKSTVIKYFIADVGPKSSCTGVKASRLDFRIVN